ncbi:MAG: hypothetical protein GW939_04350 [Candidatus Magasanikbacteria bacterium]|uniref:Uncharacterized protein n=1 Tax=Candidatus Magasanikbacteria bacterium CG10_big_fil_rev_8_21_14_0_10_38_6 TaxID=1974647 RepID=A0A2M6P299_9BACT|nr:hypothetical protein [Candidatus Magasanikbacteria bacterium]PIR77679.1 MAG: hypothetical protein COU30_01120 [Candidatus Magasanikbacteria bacterium CG10_big_fil_rev_8_21_14_0_10_38_6]
MQFTKEQIESFKALYKKEFGEELTDEQAQVEAGDLIDMLKVVCKPVKRESYEKFATERTTNK